MNLSVFCAYGKAWFGEKLGENTGLKAGGETEQALSLQKNKRTLMRVHEYIDEIKKELPYIKPGEEDDDAIEDAGKDAYMAGNLRVER